MISFPEDNEYAEFYKGYISKVEGDVITFLEKQQIRFNDLLQNIDEQKKLYRYEDGKWSVKELIGHCIDTERVMAYRLMRISKGDSTELPGFDENTYVENSNFDARAWDSLLSEFNALRTSNLILIKSLTSKQLMNIGKANTYPISARALVYIIAGHLEHHLDILIRRYIK